MDPELAALITSVRNSVDTLNATVTELNSYLLTYFQVLARPPVMYGPTLVDEPTADPRRPYQNQRQPRRDGDSFGTVQPTEGGAHAEETKSDSGL